LDKLILTPWNYWRGRDHKGRNLLWSRVCYIIWVVKLHHLLVVHCVHALKVLLIILPHLKVFVSMMLTRSRPLLVPFVCLIKWFFSISLIIWDKILVFLFFKNVWCLLRDLFVFFVVLLLRGGVLFDVFVLFVVFRFNWLYFFLLQNFCSTLNKIYLFSQKRRDIFRNILVGFNCIIGTFNLSEDVYDKSNKCFVAIAHPSVQVHNLIRLF
jgi:hypothetical protein